ncbi:hypothetical protein F2Q69_00012434 [Brassica cretica]|uniref:Uncharacterized protein n=1 Tax=Brassica cretica TaxID=69181 RepID=A0A8S9QQJ7_BRACR|nr:hypothetical protein F2Q69_00012434 [Brassica cretica]
MNFRSQKFLSPSICEYAILEEDSSPKKKRPEPKPIIGVKRSLLAFQKAQYLEKWPRKLEDMINFSKPAKPALHLPYLEDSGFTSNQPQKWQPGDLIRDTLSQPEDVQDFLQYTSTQWIRRIYSCFNLPYLESLAINLQQLLPKQVVQDFSTYQAIKKIPRKLSYPRRRERCLEGYFFRATKMDTA